MSGQAMNSDFYDNFILFCNLPSCLDNFRVEKFKGIVGLDLRWLANLAG